MPASVFGEVPHVLQLPWLLQQQHEGSPIIVLCKIRPCALIAIGASGLLLPSIWCWQNVTGLAQVPDIPCMQASFGAILCMHLLSQFSALESCSERGMRKVVCESAAQRAHAFPWLP